MPSDPGRDESSPDEQPSEDFIQSLMRSLGRGAGRATRALARLGKRGATALAMSKLRAESKRLTTELGERARRTLSEGNPLRPGDSPVDDLLKALERVDERIRNLEAEMAHQPKKPGE